LKPFRKTFIQYGLLCTALLYPIYLHFDQYKDGGVSPGSSWLATKIYEDRKIEPVPVPKDPKDPKTGLYVVKGTVVNRDDFVIPEKPIPTK